MSSPFVLFSARGRALNSVLIIVYRVNQQDQSEMSARDGVNMWNQYLVPLKNRGYTIISPSTTSAPSGIQWMKDWLAGGLAAQPDALSFHWYGTNYNDFHSYVESFIAAFPGYPLWLTEFACTVSFHVISNQNYILTLLKGL